MCSFTVVYSSNSIAEVNEYLGSKRAYLDAAGDLKASPTTETVNFVLHNLTGEPA